MIGRRECIREKVMERVFIDPETGCYDWLGPTSGDVGRGKDYPRMNLDGHTVAVHIVMWTNEFGLIPGKKTLDHACRNRKCVRPGEDEQGRMHCEMVTHKENCRRRDEANGIKRKPKRRKKAKAKPRIKTIDMTKEILGY